MSFLDNLENQLNALERQDERDSGWRQKQEDERRRSLAVRPWAEQLKNSDYTKKLFEQAALFGHRIRTKIYVAWFENNLLLEARGRRLELRPTAPGIVAVFMEPDGKTDTEPVDLNGEPEALLQKWLG
ncbi:MAG TPA: hypothetical protein VFB14_01760 [Bryobacteraceae bacterium]|jgi:hypothetical protein|nr:hypothetical protein [Bryobacteraceae bacterium]